MVWLPAIALCARSELKALMALPLHQLCALSNQTPLDQHAEFYPWRCFEPAAHEAPFDDTLIELERVLAEHGRRAALRRKASAAPSSAAPSRTKATPSLIGFVLAGDTRAEAWIKTLLEGELPAQPLWSPVAAAGAICSWPSRRAARWCAPPMWRTPPSTRTWPSWSLEQRGRERAGSSGRGPPGVAAGALQCGTNCGSCLPELKRRVRLVSASWHRCNQRTSDPDSPYGGGSGRHRQYRHE
jgi:assimilatory nitrate reductase catalytic subunit